MKNGKGTRDSRHLIDGEPRREAALPANPSRSPTRIRGTPPRQLQTQWSELVPADQWSCYLRALEAVRQTGISFMLGGAFGLAPYTGRWRNTKDIDLYILPEHRDTLVSALSKAGFSDYYDTLPYDRQWIYRSTRQGVIVDLIWAMANQRSQVTEDWFQHAPAISLRGEDLHVLPVEELFWCKLYVLQRDRCDWPDLINLLYENGAGMDWDRLISRIEKDTPLLAGVLNLFAWVCPERAARLPARVRKRFHLPPPTQASSEETCREDRVRFLDSRGWFAANQPEDQPLQL
jgi:hypothetical protein